MRIAQALATAVITTTLLGFAAGARASFEPDALMLRYPDVSATQIVFAYDNGLWVAPKEGGEAIPLTSPAGAEFLPRFSADGQRIAYSANYDGSSDIYEIAVGGGIPKRLTTTPFWEFVTGYAPDGRTVYASGGEHPRGELKLYYADPSGGLPEALPVAYGAFSSISADGQWLAFSPWTREFQTWNRYEGGTATDIWLFNLQTRESRRITDWAGTDDMPMFDGERIFYLSDAGPEHRRNIWVYNLKDNSRAQVTSFSEHEVMMPSIGPSDIVLENGGQLYLLPLDTLKPQVVKISLPGDRPHLRPRSVEVGGNMMGLSLSPQAKRVVACLRGDIWTLPAKEGYAQNLTASDGIAERDPVWSPDGKWLAYFSDRNGEYDLYLRPADGSGEEKRLTSNSNCFRFNPRFSPDSKMISFSDKTGTLFVFIIDSSEMVQVDKDPWGGGGGMAWAADSNWLAYSISDDKTSNGVIKLYDLKNRAAHQITSPMYSSGQPCFDLGGDYLYFFTNRRFSPSHADYSDWGEHYFTNTGLLALIPLRKDVASPWAPKNDKEEPKDEEKKDGDKDKGKDKDKDKKPADDKAEPDDKDAAAGDKPADNKDAEAKDGESAEEKSEGEDKDKKDDKDKAPEPLKIDLENMEARAIGLPLPNGNYYNLVAGTKKLFYIRAEGNQWCFYDFGEEPKETMLLGGIGGFELTPDASKALLGANGGWFITGAGPGAALDKPVNFGGLYAEINPQNEWRQMIMDTWRIYRDWFYDPNMHGVDWVGVRDRALKTLESAASRNDVTYIIASMVSELNASHTYVFGGGEAGPGNIPFGMLGCDYELRTDADGKSGIAFKKIYRAAAWDLDVRGPLDAPGVEVKEGDFLLAVNGTPVSASSTPYKLLSGQAGRTVELTVNAKAVKDGQERCYLVKPNGGEGELRLRDWIEANRRYIFEKSGGRIGYIYVRDTGSGGESDFTRQFVGQHEMEALIVDERWNGGGLSPQPFIDVLSRQVRNYWATRDGHSWRTPWMAAPGPKVLLINEKAGSGGDSFPYLWRAAGLGPLIGTRTWGGLIGISGNPGLIDGAGFSVPTFGIYEPDGTWTIEGHGVDPDIEVVNDPTTLAAGQDKQLDKAIEYLLEELKTKAYTFTPKPPYPDRSGMGVLPQDKR